MKRFARFGMPAIVLLIAVGITVSLAAAQVGNVRPLDPQEAATEIKPVVSLATAIQLLNTGREEQNPYLIGLSALIYYQANEGYATSLLSEATKLADANNDARALRWLAAIWASPELGAGDPEQQRTCLESAEQIEAGSRGGPEDMNPSALFPSGFFGKE